MSDPIAKASLIAVSEMSPEAIQNLLDSLAAHQLELEIQNQTLLQAKEELTASKKTYKDLYDFAPVGYCTLLDGSKINNVNQYIAKLLGVSRHQLRGVPLTQFVADEDQDVFYHFQKRLFQAEGQQQECELRMKKKDESLFWALLSATVENQNGSGQQLRLILTDITRRMKAETQLNAASKQAAMGVMAMGIAHEINNPLTVIAASLQVLLKNPNDTEKMKSTIELVQKHCHRIAKIVSGLKKYSQAGETEVHARHNLIEIINSSLALAEGKRKLEGTSIALELQGEPFIICDELAIEQVLLNLLANAIDAAKNTLLNWVKIEIDDQDDQIFLRITDSGLPISEDNAAKVFDPFYTTKQVGEGTGLGLSISKGILEDHGATITLLRETRNTCFELRFKKAPALFIEGR